MANTPFLNLVKPADTDQALITDINSNSDKIDAGVSTLSDQIGLVDAKTLKNINVSSLSELESRLLTIWEGMGDATSVFGYVRVNFTDSTIPIYGGIGSALISRRVSGTYIAQIFQPNGVLVTDYYHTSAHHWGSMQTQIANIGAKESTSGLVGTAYADITSTASNEAKIAIGKLRVYSFLITTKSSAVSPGNALLTGFDQPNDTITGGATLVIYDNSASPRTAYMGYITNTGDLASVDTIPANHSLRGSVCYIAK